MSNYLVLLSCSCPVFLVGCCPCLQEHCLAASGWLSIDLLRPSGGKGPPEIPATACCSQQGQLWGQVRLLGALIGQSLNAPKDGDCRTSLDNLLHCLAVLRGSKFLHMSSYVMVSVMPIVFCPPCGALWRACFHGSTGVSAGGPLLGPPEAVSSLGWRSFIPSVSPHRALTV